MKTNEKNVEVNFRSTETQSDSDHRQTTIQRHIHLSIVIVPAWRKYGFCIYSTEPRMMPLNCKHLLRFGLVSEKKHRKGREKSINAIYAWGVPQFPPNHSTPWAVGETMAEHQYLQLGECSWGGRQQGSQHKWVTSPPDTKWAPIVCINSVRWETEDRLGYGSH